MVGPCLGGLVSVLFEELFLAHFINSGGEDHLEQLVVVVDLHFSQEDDIVDFLLQLGEVGPLLPHLLEGALEDLALRLYIVPDLALNLIVHHPLLGTVELPEKLHQIGLLLHYLLKHELQVVFVLLYDGIPPFEGRLGHTHPQDRLKNPVQLIVLDRLALLTVRPTLHHPQHLRICKYNPDLFEKIFYFISLPHLVPISLSFKEIFKVRVLPQD